MKSLPIEVTANIIKFVNIGNERQTLIVLRWLGWYTAPDAITELIYDRRNPINCLSDISDDPKGLLNTMRLTGTILSGSRAADYFVPGSCSAYSDWDFFCPGTYYPLVYFTSYMNSKGVVWDNQFANLEEQQEQSTEPEEFDYRLMRFQFLKGTLIFKGVVHKIQVMWRPQMVASHYIVGFHSTAPQCFISGFAAVSMYHCITKNNLAVSWKNNNAGQEFLNHMIGLRSIVNINAALAPYHRWQIKRNIAAQQKYKYRGFEYIDWKKYTALYADNNSINNSDLIVGNHRYVGDNMSLIIGFRGYINTDDWDYSYLRCINNLYLIQWEERPEATASYPVSILRAYNHREASYAALLSNISDPSVLFARLRLDAAPSWFNKQDAICYSPMESTKCLPC